MNENVFINNNKLGSWVHKYVNYAEFWEGGVIQQVYTSHSFWNMFIERLFVMTPFFYAGAMHLFSSLVFLFVLFLTFLKLHYALLIWYNITVKWTFYITRKLNIPFVSSVTNWINAYRPAKIRSKQKHLYFCFIVAAQVQEKESYLFCGGRCSRFLTKTGTTAAV